MTRCPPWLSLLLLVLALVLMSRPAHAARGYGVGVSLTTANSMVADPGNVVTAALRVDADQVRFMEESFELPDGWAAVMPPGRFGLDPGQTRLRTFAFQVGPSASAGVYEVRYTLTDRADPSVHDSETLEVVVRAVSSIRLEVVQTPSFVIAGDPAQIGLRAYNGGNATIRATVSAAPESGLRADLSEKEFELGPREEKELTLDIETDAEENRPTQRIVRVQMRTPTAVSEAVVILPITPHARRLDRWRRLPARASLYATTDGTHVALQPELRGAGTLDLKERWATDFLFRGPDADGTGAFALRDEYRLAVAGPGVSIGLGDQIYSLSGLLSPNRYGRGVGVSASPGPLRLGAHVLQERFVAEPDTEIGATVAAESERLGTLGVHMLQRFGEEARDTIWSLTGTTRSSGMANLDAEFAVDTSAVRPALAGRVVASALLPGGTLLSVRETVAAPTFSGYERDVHRTDASVVVPLSRTVSTHASYRFAERNLALDRAAITAPTNHRADAGLVWAPAAGWSVNGGLAGAMQADRLGGDGWREAAARLQVGRGARRLYASLHGLAGVHADVSTGEPSLGAEIGAHVMATPSPRLSLRGSATWGSADADVTSSLYSVDSSVGAAVTWLPVDGLVADVSGRHGLQPDNPNDQLDARLQYTFRRGVQLGGRWHATVASALEQSAVLSVSVPFGVPLGRNPGSGGIQGRVYDADLPGQPGLGGVVLKVGRAVAVTDQDGTFRFARLDSGICSLQVDRATIGHGRIGLDKLPMTVRVEGGRLTPVDIGVTSVASLRGRVLQIGKSAAATTYGPVLLGAGDDVETHGVVGVNVVLTSGLERVVTVTDARGSFQIDALRPGVWTATVRPSQIPMYFEDREPGRALSLSPGQAGELDVRLEPMVRLIRMVGDSPTALAAVPAPRTAARPPRKAARRAPAAIAAAAAPAPAAAPAAAPAVAAAAAPAAAPVAAIPAPPAATPPALRTERGWARASWSGEGSVTEDGVFLGGRIALRIADGEGKVSCTVDGEWSDQGDDLPLESCPGCTWAARLEVSSVRVSGPQCGALDRDSLHYGNAPFGWAPVFDDQEAVLLRWNGNAWLPVGTSVDPEEVSFRRRGPLPR